MGISKHQWLFIFLAWLMPVLLNTVALFLETPRDLLIPAIATGSYQMRDFLDFRNPWMAILQGSSPILLVLIGLTWLVVFVSTRDFLGESHAIVRTALTAIMAFMIAAAFVIGAVKISEVWYWAFYPFRFATGIHHSQLVVVWSPPWLFITITALMWYTISLSSKHHDSVSKSPA